MKSHVKLTTVHRLCDASLQSPDVVYIGRAGKGQSGTFGNPYCSGTRKEQIAGYRRYFYTKIEKSERFRRMVMALAGKKLACPGNCGAGRCHGDVIAEFVNERSEAMDRADAIEGERELKQKIGWSFVVERKELTK